MIGDVKDEETTVKVWVQWGTALPRLGETIPVSEWDMAKYKGQEIQRVAPASQSAASVVEMVYSVAA